MGALATIVLAFSLALINRSLWWRSLIASAIMLAATFTRGIPEYRTLGVVLSIYSIADFALAVGFLSTVKDLRIGYAKAQSVRFMKHVSSTVQIRFMAVACGTLVILLALELILISGFGKA